MSWRKCSWLLQRLSLSLLPSHPLKRLLVTVAEVVTGTAVRPLAWVSGSASLVLGTTAVVATAITAAATRPTALVTAGVGGARWSIRGMGHERVACGCVGKSV